MGLPPGELVRRHRGASPRRMMAPPRRCQDIKRPRTGAAHACGVPSSEADLVRGRSRPSSEAEPARGKRTPSSGTESARGRRAPSSEAEPARGDLRVGRLGGPSGSPRRGPCPAWLVETHLALYLLRVLSGDSPGCLRGPLGPSPTCLQVHYVADRSCEPLSVV
jgi:hypothetical protein